MRQWRVGSISMGLSLIGLGVVLFISQFTNWEISKIALIWVPILLIVLGAEILIYLFLAKKEQPIIKYDVFSILFITFIGCMSIVFYVGASSGVLAAVNNYINDEQISGALPVIEEKIDNSIERIVIDSKNGLAKVTANEAMAVSIFGTYQTNAENQRLTEDDVASIHQVDNTLYVSLFSPPNHNGWDYHYTNYYPTISLPSNVDVEITGFTNQVNLELADLQANWYIDGTDIARLKNKEQANLLLTIDHINESGQNEVQTFGEGQHSLKFGEVGSLKE
ncbi:hypothetical protein [Gracilibacillus xinjiangensis]|uniref:Lipoprotein n=1 Tax=Gracilibacillus xinjiangensis TaxID=1193282 RepID=A0ABV8WZU1_9BACI